MARAKSEFSSLTSGLHHAFVGRDRTAAAGMTPSESTSPQKSGGILCTNNGNPNLHQQAVHTAPRRSAISLLFYLMKNSCYFREKKVT